MYTNKYIFWEETNVSGLVIADIWRQTANIKLKVRVPWLCYPGSVILYATSRHRWHSEWAVPIF